MPAHHWAKWPWCIINWRHSGRDVNCHTGTVHSASWTLGKRRLHHPLVDLSIHSPMHLSIYSRLHPAIHLLIHPSIYPSSEPSIHLPIKAHNSPIHPFSLSYSQDLAGVMKVWWQCDEWYESKLLNPLPAVTWWGPVSKGTSTEQQTQLTTASSSSGLTADCSGSESPPFLH